MFFFFFWENKKGFDSLPTNDAKQFIHDSSATSIFNCLTRRCVFFLQIAILKFPNNVCASCAVMQFCYRKMTKRVCRKQKRTQFTRFQFQRFKLPQRCVLCEFRIVFLLYCHRFFSSSSFYRYCSFSHLM